ncbi:hypothetical protein E2C01_102763 [Portunus trituberculatus]|uniref:Uncharacterized protein n=1 Tax=Portunus trituberculatus TaxID=210409 RepID=A0A5B7KJ95_PORTR|nr:hypothetical protein [Portunus trituberculatus]
MPILHIYSHISLYFNKEIVINFCCFRHYLPHTYTLARPSSPDVSVDYSPAKGTEHCLLTDPHEEHEQTLITLSPSSPHSHYSCHHSNPPLLILTCSSTKAIYIP